MTGTTDFLAWAIGSGANVETQSAFAADANLTDGFATGEVAPSLTCNKVWRQSSSMAAMLGQFIANSGQNAADNGNITQLVAQFIAAFESTAAATKSIQAITGSSSQTVPSGVYTYKYRVWGAGGAGGGAGTGVGGGGAGGAYSEGYFSVVPGDTVSWVIASVSVGGAGNGNGGGTSTLSHNGTVIVTCTGGPGGIAGSSGNPVLGGAATATASGTAGSYNVAGTEGSVGNGLAGSASISGDGGNAFGGGGARGNTSTTGNHAIFYGCGGAGGAGGANGGNGGLGLLILET
jgi:hypothetical protein